MITLIIAILVFVVSIFLGARKGGLGIGFAAGIGLFIYTMIMGFAPGTIPVNVVFIIMTVIGAIAVLELSGGLAYMVSIAERILRKNPKQINILAPLSTFILACLAGTGHTVYSLLPVITEVAQGQGIKPVRPLSSAVVASQIALTASPITAAVVAFSGYMDKFGIGLPKLMLILFPSALLGCLLVGFLQKFLPQDLNKDENYLKLLASGEIKKPENKTKEVKKEGKLAVLLFLIGVVVVVIFAAVPSLKITYADGTKIDNALMIMIIMLVFAFLMLTLTKVKVSELTSQSTFKAGMSAALCVIGVAWLGDTLISHYKESMQVMAGGFLHMYPWAFAVVLFVVAMLLYSQAATTAAMMPLGIALGLSPLTLIASFVAVDALFVLPTYPTVIAAVQMDYTGTTKLGKYVFNHPFIIPGVLAIVFSIIFAYLIGLAVL